MSTDAIQYCNARSTQEGRTPAYVIDSQNASWDRSVNGYRLPTEAEWEYTCRAGTDTSFNTETSISEEETNHWGHYPYLIEDNYTGVDLFEIEMVTPYSTGYNTVLDQAQEAQNSPRNLPPMWRI